MRRAVNHDALAAAGYFAQLDIRAGTEASFHLSTRDTQSHARILRLDHAADAQPMAWAVRRTAALLDTQCFELGSWLEIAALDRFLSAPWSLALEFRVADLPHDRVLLASDGIVILFDAKGCLALEVGGVVTTGQILPSRQWLNAVLCSAADRVVLTVAAGATEIASLSVAASGIVPTYLCLGTDFGMTVPTMNVGVGRITLSDHLGHVAAAWRFPSVGRPERLTPVEGSVPVLEVHNAPTFGLRSPRWDGSVLDPRLKPEHYDAVALHDDDLAEADWPETHRIVVPETAESGVYAIEIATGAVTTRWPFFVSPSRRQAGRRQADLAFLAPTFTYLAYADERLPPERFPWLCDDAGHRFAKDNQLTSLYDTHNDGSGVSLASFRRPLATLRDDYRYPLCGAPHLLPVDLHLLRFLHAQGIKLDVITDGDLHRRGVEGLDGYRGLVTGSHPEYWTGAMLDGLTDFRDRGGHIAYLGGNGGYWVTACDGDTIEVRRGLSGIRTWSSEPGETHCAMTGEPGGLWRHRGRAEHQLLGAGLRAMGFSLAQPFRRTQDSYAADLNWLFAGVGDEPIGDTGLVLDGAAGYEIDARSTRWGTSAQSRLLAVAEGFDEGYVIDSDATEDGLPEPVRGEMVLTEHPSGSKVFAASSVSWCGALPQAGTMNAVGRITMNLLRHFAH